MESLKSCFRPIRILRRIFFRLHTDGKKAILTLQIFKSALDISDEAKVKIYWDMHKAVFKDQIISQKAHKISGKYPALDLELKNELNKTKSKVRFVLSGRDSCELTVEGSDDYHKSKEASKFFDSLKILK